MSCPAGLPYCPRCGHHHDPEFDCEMDCLTCMVVAEELAMARERRMEEGGPDEEPGHGYQGAGDYG